MPVKRSERFYRRRLRFLGAVSECKPEDSNAGD
jgi:hypothetical protein